MPNLVGIRLHENSLDTNDLPDDFLDGVKTTLKIVKLLDNLLTEVRTHQFSGLSVLEELDLSDNQINNIQPGRLTCTQCILTVTMATLYTLQHQCLNFNVSYQ